MRVIDEDVKAPARLDPVEPARHTLQSADARSYGLGRDPQTSAESAAARIFDTLKRPTSGVSTRIRLPLSENSNVMPSIVSATDVGYASAPALWL